MTIFWGVPIFLRAIIAVLSRGIMKKARSPDLGDSCDSFPLAPGPHLVIHESRLHMRVVFRPRQHVPVVARMTNERFYCINLWTILHIQSESIIVQIVSFHWWIKQLKQINQIKLKLKQLNSSRFCKMNHVFVFTEYRWSQSEFSGTCLFSILRGKSFDGWASQQAGNGRSMGGNPKYSQDFEGFFGITYSITMIFWYYY